MMIRAEETTGSGGWRIAGWGIAAALFLLPAAAMLFTREVNWDETDFITWGVMIGSVGLALEFLLRRAAGPADRIGRGLALLTLFLLVWVNLAVGIIGSEQNDANMMYAGVIAIAVGGAFLGRFRPRGMLLAALVTAAAQVLVGVIALVGNLGTDGIAWPRDVIGATGLFTALWIGAATMFWVAARYEADPAR